MRKRKKALVTLDPNCLNCGYPFTKNEKFCPECGQKNKGSKITFASFTREMFRGFFSWDAKFWRTLVPLMIKPGKVSKNYIAGQRNRYSNPFRFYLSISILFFLLLSARETHKKFNDLNSTETIDRNIPDLQIDNSESGLNLQLLTPKQKDSLTNRILKQINSTKARANKRSIDSIENDTIQIKPAAQIRTYPNYFSTEYLGPLYKFSKLHPYMKTDAALDSMKLEKNFSNRFWYSRVNMIHKITKDDNELNKLLQQVISLGSIALFILLPLFTLSLKIIYIRRKYTYIEHLIFVFHIQTVFFLLLIFFLLMDIFSSLSLEQTTTLFISLFAVYLYMAMKTFYNQGYFKTFMKYLIANFFFLVLTNLGIILLSAFVFAMY